MTADRLVTTHLTLCFGHSVARVEPKIIFSTQIELVYFVTETPSTKFRARMILSGEALLR